MTVAILPGSESYQDKRGLQLGYDEETRTLLLLWTEDISAYSHIRVGVFRDGVWTNSALLPSQGISRAYNPEMRVTHQRVTYLDETDAVVAKTSSIVSVVWWEEADVAPGPPRGPLPRRDGLRSGQPVGLRPSRL